MRFVLAGILLMIVATAARGQAEGEVELVGFGGWYRPHCWVPMKLRLRPTVGDAETYRIQVIQEDMDRDRVSFSRPFTLNGNRPGERREEQVWVYFRPQPHDLDRAITPADLSSAIRVFLCKGDKQLVQIKFSAGTGLKNLDATTASGRGTRLVIGLTTSGSQPNLSAYSNAYGMVEDIVYLPVTANDLPTNPLGFEAVDDLIWDHPDPSQLNPDAIAAVEGWVKSGGRMVVCQSIEWQKVRDGPLAGMLPVVPTGMSEEQSARTLRRIGGVPDLEHKLFSTDLPVETDPWADLRGKSIPLCLAAPRPGARVQEWSDAPKPSPYLARWMYGLGMVTWVAQDFGSPALQSKTPMRLYGWGKIWDTVLGLRNATMMHPDTAKDSGFPVAFVDRCVEVTKKYPKNPSATTVDLSRSFVSSTEIPGRAAALVLLAIVFFIGYWLVACLGSYFYLLRQKKAQQSWFFFAVCAVGATGVTALFVKLVLRGAPEMQHVSFVRWSGGADTRVLSQLGLLVKEDKKKQIELKDATVGLVSTVTPLPAHPRHNADWPDFLGYLEYDVPVPERSSGGPVMIEVPFRRTLKKLQLDWTGPGMTGLGGSASLGSGSLKGTLTNLTGHDLHQVYIAYNTGTGLDDTLLRLLAPEGKPAWAKGDSINLGSLLANRKFINYTKPDPSALCTFGLLNSGWMPTFGDALSNAKDPAMGNRESAFLLMSLFDRIQPSMWISKDQPNYAIHRWTGRRLDASAAILTGNMVILARADDGNEDISPLPVTLEMAGEKMAGKGSVYYQFVVPLERPPETPTTQPVEK